MKETIWKYDIKIGGLNHLFLPVYSKVLCVQVQNENPVIWVKVNPENRKEDRCFSVFGTGFEIETKDVEKIYIGSFQLNDGSFVGHLFELIQ